MERYLALIEQTGRKHSGTTRQDKEIIKTVRHLKSIMIVVADPKRETPNATDRL